jgi:thiamine kinase
VGVVEDLMEAGIIPFGTAVEETPLSGGYWNTVVKLDLGDGRRWVAKRFAAASDNPYFPNHPDAEAAATLLVAGLGISSEPVAYMPEARLLVTEFLDGPSWDGSVGEAARLLRRVHAIEPVGLRQVPVGPARILAHARAILEWGGATLDLAVPRPAGEGRAGSLVHTDCGPGNMISSPQGLRLIDWQCPGDGDPVEDLACFTSPAMQILYRRAPLTRPDVDSFLDSYDHAQTIDRFRALRPAYHWRIAAYCAARANRLARSEPEVAARYRTALAAETQLLEELA